MRFLRWASIPVVGLLVLNACGGPPKPATQAGVREADGQIETCRVARDPLNPFVVEWPATSKTALDTTAQQGAVVVSYVGCNLKVLPRCRAPGTYRLLVSSPARDSFELSSANDLYARLPLGAASLKGQLASGNSLRLSYISVGQKTLGAPPPTMTGDCEGATHFVDGITVGAFTLDTSAHSTVSGGVAVGNAGAGGERREGARTLRSQGDMERCERVSPGADCGAVLQLTLVALAKSGAGAQVPRSDQPPPAVPNSRRWAGEGADPCFAAVVNQGGFSDPGLTRALDALATSRLADARRFGQQATKEGRPASERAVAYFMFGHLFELDAKNEQDPRRLELAKQTYEELVAKLDGPLLPAAQLRLAAIDEGRALHHAERAIVGARNVVGPLEECSAGTEARATAAAADAYAKAKDRDPAQAASYFSSMLGSRAAPQALGQLARRYAELRKPGGQEVIEAALTAFPAARCALLQELAAMSWGPSKDRRKAAFQDLASAPATDPECHLAAVGAGYVLASAWKTEALGDVARRGTNDRKTVALALELATWVLANSSDDELRRATYPGLKSIERPGGRAAVERLKQQLEAF